jgi:hypothetical protein
MSIIYAKEILFIYNVLLPEKCFSRQQVLPAAYYLLLTYYFI